MLCDENGNLTTPMSKSQVHSEGLLHKAFSVFVVRDGKMLLQRRAASKYHSPLLWSNACCSHYIPDEKSVKRLVAKRLKQELGCKLKRLTYLFDFSYKTRLENGLIENEHDTVFLADVGRHFSLNSNEVESIKWIDICQLSTEIESNSSSFTYWFLQCYKKVLKMTI